MYQNGLVVSVVPYVLEEYAASKQRYLQGLDVDVGSVGAPCVCADSVGYEGGKQAVEVEKKEDSAGTSVRDEVVWGWHTYRMEPMRSSTR
jgi:hypothetical protein